VKDQAEAALELDTRRRIFEFLEKVPGAHFREIHRRLDIPTSVVEYHLKYMEDRDMLVSRMEGRYKRYYVQGRMGSSDKTLLSMLRQKVPRRIIMHVALNPGVNHRDLTDAVGISPSTLSYHMKKLLGKEVLRQVREGRENRYWVVDEDAVGQALLTYKESFLDEVVDSFAQTWADIHP
jgi:predicted transcriptional regulator